MSKDDSITYHYRIVEVTPRRFIGEVYVKYIEPLPNDFTVERKRVLSMIYPFASETTARKYTKRELNKVMKEFPKYKLKETLNVLEA